MVNINQADFGTLCICALRYCHGRRTYMPRLIQEIVQRHFKDLSENDLRLIADDERFQADMKLWGDYCDQVDWENFYQNLRDHMQTATAKEDSIIESIVSNIDTENAKYSYGKEQTERSE